MATQDAEFAFKEGPGIFAPKDLIQLGRPGAPIVNSVGNLALVPFSQFSFEDKKNKKSAYIVSLESDGKTVQIPLEKGGEHFWLTPTTFAHVVAGEDNSEVHAYEVALSTSSSESEEKGYKSQGIIATIPSKTAANFRYNEDT